MSGRGDRPASSSASAASDATQRLDKWLWFVRLVKTRTLAAGLVISGKVRVNKVKVDKPAYLLRPGDVVTAVAGARVRVLKVVAAGERRGPPETARQLYEELTPAPVAPKPLALNSGAESPHPGSVRRPDKRERRQIARLRRQDD